MKKTILFTCCAFIIALSSCSNNNEEENLDKVNISDILDDDEVYSSEEFYDLLKNPSDSSEQNENIIAYDDINDAST